MKSTLAAAESPPPKASITIVLLSYNRPAYLREALRSIADQTLQPTEVIVVDNPSRRSSDIAAIVQEFAGVQLVQPHRNLGFTGGMNLGIRSAKAEYIYLTEDDVVLGPDCLAHLFSAVSLDESIGLAGPVMYHYHSGRVDHAGAEIVRERSYSLRVHFDEPPAAAATADVSYLTGAAMFGRAVMWRSTGGFRDDFFMYSEDVELCLRVSDAGLRIVVVPQAKVRHFERSPSKPSAEIEYHKLKNRMALHLLHHGLRQLPRFLLGTLVASVRPSSGGSLSQLMSYCRAVRWVTVNAPRLRRSRGSAGEPWSGR